MKKIIEAIKTGQTIGREVINRPEPHHGVGDGVRKRRLIEASTDSEAEVRSLQTRLKNKKRTCAIIRYAAAGVAASFFVALSVHTGRVESLLPESFIAHEQIPAGTTKAVLVLTDRSTVDLDSATNISEYLDRTPGGNPVSENNKIIIPRGGEYNLTLPDGTRVWLNSESSLEFPPVFAPDSRTVRVTGEAYFAVAPDASRPFFVQSGNLKIRALGTEFNVRNYSDEQNIRVVLVEGKVLVSDQAAATENTLTPGHMFQFDAVTGKASVSEIHTCIATAWKDGYIYYKQESMATLASNLSRWYDVEIYYSSEVAGYVFTGSVSKYETAEQVLEVLSLTGGLKYTFDDKRIYITKSE